MSRLAPLDKALVLILVPLWVVCFALGVKTQADDIRMAPIGLSLASAESYPVLTGEFDPAHPSDPLEAAGLRAGDRLIHIDGVDLRGVGTLGFSARTIRSRERHAAVRYERGGERREASLSLVSLSIFRPWLATSFTFAASALFLLLRARPTPVVRRYFYAAMCVAFALCMFAGSRPEYYARVGSFFLATSMVYPLVLRFALVFPDEAAPPGRWHHYWPWLFALMGPFNVALYTGHAAVGTVGAYGTQALALVALAAVATHKYRRADLAARRQIKWVLFGAYCAAIPVMVASGAAAWDPELHWLFFPSFWAVAIFPAFLFVSIARFNLFDIDRLLSGAVSYTVVVILLAIGGEVLLEPLAGRAAAVLGIAPATGQVAFVAMLAAVLVPAQRAWRPYVDRVFFAEGRTREQEIEALLVELVQSDSHATAVELTGAGIERAFLPEFCAIYERAGEQFEPSYTSGAPEFPLIPAASEFSRALETKVAPVLLDARGAAEAPAALRSAPVAGAAAIVPLRPGGALLAFIAIGPKRSGDVYPPTDLSLLTTLGHTVSASLERVSHSM